MNLESLEARRDELMSELLSAESTLMSLWSRMPDECRFPVLPPSCSQVSNAMTEPRVPSHRGDEDRNGIGKMNGAMQGVVHRAGDWKTV